MYQGLCPATIKGFQNPYTHSQQIVRITRPISIIEIAPVGIAELAFGEILGNDGVIGIDIRTMIDVDTPIYYPQILFRKVCLS